MRTPNPQLVVALDGCRPRTTYTDEWNERMSYLSTQIQLDRFDNRGPQYNRNTFTVAAMLSADANLRNLVQAAGFSLAAFDDIVRQAQAIMLAKTTGNNPAVKIANVLNKLRSGDY